MHFAVESWDPAYGVSGDEGALTDPGQSVDSSVEVPLDQWAPIRPDRDTRTPPVIWFVDGVRRIDARIWVTNGSDGADDGAGAGMADLAYPGVCATVAAGAVRCSVADGTTPGSAQIVTAAVERALYTAAPNAGPIVTRHGTYELRPAVGEGDEALYLAVHNHMTSVETTLAIDPDPLDVVVFDGPLRGRESATDVGYVKTHNVQYLPTEQHRIVGRLGAGERTPVFLIGGRFTKWSWYLRLPGPISHPLSGVVRLELPGLGTADDAIGRADIVSAALPRFASQPHKDTRAPQNLHPIAGLERELRRRLGDARLLERALRSAA